MAVDRMPCPCGAEAVRQAIYSEQTIIGETVAGSQLGNTCRDRNGRYDLGLVTEAQHEIIYDAERAGVEPPDLWKDAKRRARTPLRTE
jgi:hypothetical protein